MKNTERSENMSARVAGYSASKSHWQNVKIHGTQTACRRRLSGGGENNEMFSNSLERFPEFCCKKCATAFNYFTNRNLKK
jgi:hypothetical protein